MIHVPHHPADLTWSDGLHLVSLHVVSPTRIFVKVAYRDRLVIGPFSARIDGREKVAAGLLERVDTFQSWAIARHPDGRVRAWNVIEGGTSPTDRPPAALLDALERATVEVLEHPEEVEAGVGRARTVAAKAVYDMSMQGITMARLDLHMRQADIDDLRQRWKIGRVRPAEPFGTVVETEAGPVLVRIGGASLLRATKVVGGTVLLTASWGNPVWRMTKEVAFHSAALGLERTIRAEFAAELRGAVAARIDSETEEIDLLSRTLDRLAAEAGRSMDEALGEVSAPEEPFSPTP